MSVSIPYARCTQCDKEMEPESSKVSVIKPKNQKHVPYAEVYLSCEQCKRKATVCLNEEQIGSILIKFYSNKEV